MGTPKHQTMRSLHLAFIGILSTVLPCVSSQGYLVGDPEAVCWKTTNGVTKAGLCTGKTNIEFVKVPPRPWYSDQEYMVEYKLTVDKCDFATGISLEPSKGWDVPHANVHSCLAHMGACTPFVGNTPGLATHTPALKGNLKAVVRRTECVWEGIYTSPVKLVTHNYMMIAHGRFFTSDGTKHDVAQGLSLSVNDPVVESAIDTGALIALASAAALAWFILTAPPIYKLYTMNTDEASSLLSEWCVESFLDAIELASAITIFSEFKSDPGASDIALWIMVTMMTLNILGADLACVYYLYCLPNPDVVRLEFLRRCHSLATTFLVIPLSAMEVGKYLDDGNLADLICIIFLSVDVGSRIKGSVTLILELKKGSSVSRRPNKAGQGAHNPSESSDVKKPIQNAPEMLEIKVGNTNQAMEMQVEAERQQVSGRGCLC